VGPSVTFSSLGSLVFLLDCNIYYYQMKLNLLVLTTTRNNFTVHKKWTWVSNNKSKTADLLHFGCPIFWKQ
jgi:hypothetical protein